MEDIELVMNEILSRSSYINQAILDDQQLYARVTGKGAVESVTAMLADSGLLADPQ